MLHEVTVTWDDQAEVISWDIERVPRGFAVAMAHYVQSRADSGDTREFGAPERTPCTCGEATTERADILATVVGGIVHRFDRRPCYLRAESAGEPFYIAYLTGSFVPRHAGYYRSPTYNGGNCGGPW